MSEEDKYKNCENMAYDKLFDYIRLELFKNPKVIKLTDLTDKLIAWMGMTDVKQSTKTHLRRKVEFEFKDTLKYLSMDNRSVLVYPTNLS
jgi:hypothetical protein